MEKNHNSISKATAKENTSSRDVWIKEMCKEMKESDWTAFSSGASSGSSSSTSSNGYNISDGLAKFLVIKTKAVKSCSSSSTSFSAELESEPSNKNHIETNLSNSSPCLVSPASSAFVSALQSPYVSPRAVAAPTLAVLLPSPSPSPHSHAIPSNSTSTSCTPPPERSEFSDVCISTDHDHGYESRLNYPDDQAKLKEAPPPSLEASAAAAHEPRISFSFPVVPSRTSFARRSSVSSVSNIVSNARLRSCDVFIGYHSTYADNSNSDIVRFCKWLKSELELQGIACFLADRARYADCQSHEIADRVICSVTYGIIVVSSSSSLSNRFCIEELKIFSQKNNLIPIFFDKGLTEIISSEAELLGSGHERKEAVDALIKCCQGYRCKLEAGSGDWRNCISKTAGLLTSKLGRKCVAGEKEQSNPRQSCEAEELPFPRNKNFVGREQEMSEIELAFFRSSQHQHKRGSVQIKGSESRSSHSSEGGGFADGETDHETRGEGDQQQRYISIEVANCIGGGGGGPSISSESWTVGGESVRSSSFKRMPKYKRSKSNTPTTTLVAGSSVVCITGPPGSGKTELALEFAHRHAHRYKQVLWVGGEARYMRQNILTLSQRLCLDLSADPEKERGRIRSFEEQENEAFKRVKRELFKDMPYLIVVDNLESEGEWWEGKYLHDLIPTRNTGGSHVIVTTRLERLMSYNNAKMVRVQPLPLTEAMELLIRGGGKFLQLGDDGEMDCVKKFSERLERSAFGLSLVGSLLSELSIDAPSALYDAVENHNAMEDEEEGGAGFSRNTCPSSFMMKLLGFCFSSLEKANKTRNCLASRMLLVGSWFAPSPVSATLLAAAAKNMTCSTPSRLQKLKSCLNQAIFCSGSCSLPHQTWNNQSNSSALALVRLGLARKTTRQQGGQLWIQFHPIVIQFFTSEQLRKNPNSSVARAAVVALRKTGDPLANSDHLWASAYLIFGFKSERPVVELRAGEMVGFIKKTALPLAVWAFTMMSRCWSALELLKACTEVLEEAEKSFVSQAQDWWNRQWQGTTLCWKNRLLSKNQTQTPEKVVDADEYVWQEVTLLKATLLETRAKLLLRGGQFEYSEELCRTCISIRTVMLGHAHPHTLAAQQTLAKLVRLRSKI